MPLFNLNWGREKRRGLVQKKGAVASSDEGYETGDFKFSKCDAETPNRTTTTLQVKPKKPRRHTTGDTKQTTEDIRLAKEMVDTMNGGGVVGVGGQPNPTELGGPIDLGMDPNSTLGRKQLISMLKQRYGNEMDSFRTSGDISEKERIRKERQRERDLRHSQRMVQENREMINHGGVHHSPAINGNREHFSGTGSEGSDDSLHIANGRTKYVSHTKSLKHRIVRRSDSEDDCSKDGSAERIQIPPAASFNNSDNVIRSKGVVFLQCADDVKRVNLPATVTSIDTLKALFVTSFPERMTMQDFEDGLKSVYIKDADTGTYYMLEDVGEVLNRSFLKIHEKAPSIQSGSQILLTSSENLSITQSKLTPKSSSIEYTTSSADSSPRIPTVNGTPNVIKTTSHSTSHKTESRDHVANGNVPQRSSSSETTHIHIKGVYSQSNTPRRILTQDRPDNVLPTTSATVNGLDTKLNRSNTYSSSNSATVHDVMRTPIVKTRCESYTSSTSKPDSVEDQLDDLTELLKTALDDEELHHVEIMECVNTKNPGKLNPNLLEKIQNETQTLARKSTLPKYFQPTVMVAAQQESDRRTSERSNSESDSSPNRANSTAKTKTIEKVTRDEHIVNRDLNNNNNNKNEQVPVVTINHQEVFKETEKHPPKENKVNYINIDALDAIDGIITDEIRTESETAKTETQKSGSMKSDSHSESDTIEIISDVNSSNISETTNTSDSAATLSDVLMDQIMDMELEVKARSHITLKNSERSSTGSTCSKSSVPCSTEKLSTADVDPPRINASPLTQESVESNRSSMRDNTVQQDTSVTENENSVNIVNNVNYSTINKTASEIEEEVFQEIMNNNAPITSNGPTSMQHIYASISKVTDLPTSSKVTTTFSSTTKSDINRTTSVGKRGTGETAYHHASVTTPDFIELEDSAKNVHVSLQELRKDLATLRKSHVDGVKSFKADIQKKLLEFRKKAARVDDCLQQKLDVNNNTVFANEHPVRERRHRLTSDQISYNKKMSGTEHRLKYLEGDMERVRISVVNKKRVENPQNLKELHEELTQLTKGLAEIKNRFHGLHDMLKIVMPDEMKIISEEERFLKEEPQKLEGLIGRCKVLSGTLFTLERLASVQLEQGDGVPQTQTQLTSRSLSQSTANTTHTSYIKQTSATKSYNHAFKQPVANNDVFDIEDLKGKRNVRFGHKH